MNRLLSCLLLATACAHPSPLMESQVPSLSNEAGIGEALAKEEASVEGEAAEQPLSLETNGWRPDPSQDLYLFIGGLPKGSVRSSDRQVVRDRIFIVSCAGGAVYDRVKLSQRAPTRVATMPIDLRASPALRKALSSKGFTPADAALAAEIVSGRRDAWEAARALAAWVGANEPPGTEPQALRLLALAWAAGLPARRIDGLSLEIGDGYARPWASSWVEVYVGEWVSLDPTQGPEPVDAFHVELVGIPLAKLRKLVSRLDVLADEPPKAAQVAQPLDSDQGVARGTEGNSAP